MSVEYDTILDHLQKASLYELNGADYTITDDDGYTEIWVTTGGADRTITLPTLADNLARHIKVKNMDGSASVIVDGEGAETINGTATVEITEEGGWWIFTAGSSEWSGDTDGWSTIYYVESEAADSGLTLDGTWDDVSGIVLLNGIYGKFFLDAHAVQYGVDSSYPVRILLGWGIGKTAGNNDPDIFHDDYIGFELNDQYCYTDKKTRNCHNWEYESDGSSIYMKANLTSAESPGTGHVMYGASNRPMYIKARRIY